MKKLLLALLLLPVFAKGQFIYLDGSVIGTSTFTFSTGDSLEHFIPYGYFYDSAIITIDTSGTALWQLGKTLKPAFSNGTIPVRGLMTDTLNSYPANANKYFLLKVYYSTNYIIDFWHRYQTDSLHAGGMVEFSTDSGATWINVMNCSGVGTQNMYAQTDTLNSGQPAFTGTSSGEQLSRFQFMNCVTERTTVTSCFPDYTFSFYRPIFIRFRFVSDSAISSLSGWMIDSIEIENTGCGTGIPNVADGKALTIYPNPATTQLTITAPNAINDITITNLLGQIVRTSADLSILRQSSGQGAEVISIDVSGLPVGLYFVKVNGSEVRKFLKE